MIKYNKFSPASSSAPAPAHEVKTKQNILDQWVANKVANSTAEMAHEGMSFALKTDAGTLSYKPNVNGNYTEFLRVTIEMMLAFNSSEVDPEFKKVLKRAFLAYENGEDFGDDDDDDDEDLDFVATALSSAQDEAEKYEKGVQYINSLAKSDSLTLKILQSHSENITPSRVEKLIEKLTDLPPNILHSVVHNAMPFTLSFEKASEVYTSLRMLDIPITVKSGDDKSSSTKKASASKKTTKQILVKKSSTTKKASAKKTTKHSNTKTGKTLTGSERLQTTVGIIQE